MMVEITGDPIMIFPVGFTTIFAVIVGNWVNHGLYHALFEIYWVRHRPARIQYDMWRESATGMPLEDMMPRNDPIVVPAQGGRAGISAAIDGRSLTICNNYSGFPLVNEDGAVIGLCDRKGLE
ncbi:unnamed protein product, partial [Polarella glacialis]